MKLCPRCEHEQDRHTIVDFGCSVVIGDDDRGPIICECERLFDISDVTEMADLSAYPLHA